jgi:ParB/RepB/Spo0J family partition protein
MNARAAIAKIALSAPLSKAAAGPPPRIVPSAPEPIALGTLERAPENVRHVRIDEDVTGLADDIAAHGLLQSLIGYRDGHVVRIVGGGRRLQALRRLAANGLIDARFRVPVLIRDAADALELSLAENLQQRTMSPVDEFFAFKALIDTGHHSPAGLAARFGFSERVVKQRLRLADLAPVILDALAARELTLDAAMAYAGTADRELQAEIFAVEKRRSHDPHRLANIRHAITAKGMKVDHPVMTYLGVDNYEAAGGGYDDGLFTGATDVDRVVDRPMLAVAKAAERIDAEISELLAEICEDPDFAPTVTGYVVAPGLRLHSWGSQDAKGPPGSSRVDGLDARALWTRIRETGVDVRILVGIDGAGALKIHPRTVFVSKADRRLLDPPGRSGADDAAARAAAERARGVDLWARRLSVGSFEGTPFEGRAYWPEPHEDRSRPNSRDGIPGQFVHIYVFVPDALAATKRTQAERHYDKAVNERAAVARNRSVPEPAPADVAGTEVAR